MKKRRGNSSELATEIPDIPANDQVLDLPALPARVKVHPQFHSRFLEHDRDISVYVPPGYEEEPHRDFPVLYLHDGQNLFDPRTSFVRGQTWRVAETADVVIEAREVEPLVIVGIANSGEQRLAEYTPVRDRKLGGGEAGKYGRLITEELMPFIRSNYRTLEGPAHTGLGGSSLGGLATLYLGLKYSKIFGRLAALSPSIWWGKKNIIGYVNEARPACRPRIWLDIGDAEGPRALADADLLERRLKARGWRTNIDLHYEHIAGGTHDEAAWAERVGPMLRFLYPAVRRENLE
ncbi:MAG: alpha/beta hydrolase-fold protein [Silvibacterium sp.]